MRLIDENGEMIGIVPTRDALFKAEEAGLDLVEISPNADPPVCKILDFGKFRYQEQKKRTEAKKKQKVIEIKELMGAVMTGRSAGTDLAEAARISAVMEAAIRGSERNGSEGGGWLAV